MEMKAQTFRFDLRQGGLGDCWMVTTMAGLAMHPKDLQKVGEEKRKLSILQFFCFL